LTRKRSEVQIL